MAIVRDGQFVIYDIDNINEEIISRINLDEYKNKQKDNIISKINFLNSEMDKIREMSGDNNDFIHLKKLRSIITNKISPQQINDILSEIKGIDNLNIFTIDEIGTITRIINSKNKSDDILNTINPLLKSKLMTNIPDLTINNLKQYFTNVIKPKKQSCEMLFKKLIEDINNYNSYNNKFIEYIELERKLSNVSEKKRTKYNQLKDDKIKYEIIIKLLDKLNNFTSNNKKIELIFNEFDIDELSDIEKSLIQSEKDKLSKDFKKYIFGNYIKSLYKKNNDNIGNIVQYYKLNDFYKLLFLDDTDKINIINSNNNFVYQKSPNDNEENIKLMLDNFELIDYTHRDYNYFRNLYITNRVLPTSQNEFCFPFYGLTTNLQYILNSMQIDVKNDYLKIYNFCKIYFKDSFTNWFDTFIILTDNEIFIKQNTMDMLKVFTFSGDYLEYLAIMNYNNYYNIDITVDETLSNESIKKMLSTSANKINDNFKSFIIDCNSFIMNNNINFMLFCKELNEFIKSKVDFETNIYKTVNSVINYFIRFDINTNFSKSFKYLQLQEYINYLKDELKKNHFDKYSFEFENVNKTLLKMNQLNKITDDQIKSLILIKIINEKYLFNEFIKATDINYANTILWTVFYYYVKKNNLLQKFINYKKTYYLQDKPEHIKNILNYTTNFRPITDADLEMFTNQIFREQPFEIPETIPLLKEIIDLVKFDCFYPKQGYKIRQYVNSYSLFPFYIDNFHYSDTDYRIKRLYLLNHFIIDISVLGYKILLIKDLISKDEMFNLLEYKKYNVYISREAICYKSEYDCNVYSRPMCGEATLLNLILVMLFNKETSKIDTSYLSDTTLPSVKLFFETHFNKKNPKQIASLFEDQNILNDFAINIIGKIPFFIQLNNNDNNNDRYGDLKNEIRLYKHTLYSNIENDLQYKLNENTSLVSESSTIDITIDHDLKNKIKFDQGFEIRGFYFNVCRIFSYIFGIRNIDSQEMKDLYNQCDQDVLKDILLTFKNPNNDKLNYTFSSDNTNNNYSFYFYGVKIKIFDLFNISLNKHSDIKYIVKNNLDNFNEIIGDNRYYNYMAILYYHMIIKLLNMDNRLSRINPFEFILYSLKIKTFNNFIKSHTETFNIVKNIYLSSDRLKHKNPKLINRLVDIYLNLPSYIYLTFNLLNDNQLYSYIKFNTLNDDQSFLILQTIKKLYSINEINSKPIPLNVIQQLYDNKNFKSLEFLVYSKIINPHDMPYEIIGLNNKIMKLIKNQPVNNKTVFDKIIEIYEENINLNKPIEDQIFKLNYWYDKLTTFEEIYQIIDYVDNKYNLHIDSLFNKFLRLKSITGDLFNLPNYYLKFDFFIDAIKYNNQKYIEYYLIKYSIEQIIDFYNQYKVNNLYNDLNFSLHDYLIFISMSFDTIQFLIEKLENKKLLLDSIININIQPDKKNKIENEIINKIIEINNIYNINNFKNFTEHDINDLLNRIYYIFWIRDKFDLDIFNLNNNSDLSSKFLNFYLLITLYKYTNFYNFGTKSSITLNSIITHLFSIDAVNVNFILLTLYGNEFENDDFKTLFITKFNQNIPIFNFYFIGLLNKPYILLDYKNNGNNIKPFSKFYNLTNDIMNLFFNDKNIILPEFTHNQILSIINILNYTITFTNERFKIKYKNKDINKIKPINDFNKKIIRIIFGVIFNNNYFIAFINSILKYEINCRLINSKNKKFTFENQLLIYNLISDYGNNIDISHLFKKQNKDAVYILKNQQIKYNSIFKKFIIKLIFFYYNNFNNYIMNDGNVVLESALSFINKIFSFNIENNIYKSSFDSITSSNIENIISNIKVNKYNYELNNYYFKNINVNTTVNSIDVDSIPFDIDIYRQIIISYPMDKLTFNGNFNFNTDDTSESSKNKYIKYKQKYLHLKKLFIHDFGSIV